ncbi:MAG: phosphoribosyltransferase [Gammaproteobacteria bacterium]
MLFKNRQQAGEKLAEKLKSLVQKGSLNLSDAVVIALPRGGLPVGLEVARALKLPLDVCVVRKVGAPSQPELAVAAVAEGGEIVVNEDISRLLGLSHEEIEKLAAPKRVEVDERVKKFRSGAAAIRVKDKTVILVDDGLATGATALTAIHVLKKREAARIILAVPVCPASTVATFEAEVDKFVVLSTPEDFYAVGQWYINFDQVSDDQVQGYLQQAGEDADICA